MFPVERDADADAGPAAGADGGGGDEDEAVVQAWLDKFASDLVYKHMPEDWRQELEMIAAQAEGTPISPDQVQRLAKALKKPMKQRWRVSRQECNDGWSIPARQAKRNGKGKKKPRNPVAAIQRVELSEENKEDLKCIAAAMVDEMIPQLRRRVALDPRIERFSVGRSERFKKRIIDDFKTKLRDRRKSEINALIAARKLCFEGVTIKAFASVRSVLVGMGLGFALPTSRVLKAPCFQVRQNQSVGRG